jgi:hypothetical protein
MTDTKRTSRKAVRSSEAVSRLDPERTFRLWRDAQPYRGATDKEHRAFIAGFKAALNPDPLSVDEMQAVAIEFARKYAAKRQAFIDAGKCPDCEGKGVVGGQFSGGPLICETCSGSGKQPANVL